MAKRTPDQEAREAAAVASPPTYYEMLGIPQGVSPDHMRNSVRLLRENHPDWDQAAPEKAKALAVLSDPIKRQQYDAELAKRNAQTMATSQCPHCGDQPYVYNTRCGKCGWVHYAPGEEVRIWEVISPSCEAGRCQECKGILIDWAVYELSDGSVVTRPSSDRLKVMQYDSGAKEVPGEIICCVHECHKVRTPLESLRQQWPET